MITFGIVCIVVGVILFVLALRRNLAKIEVEAANIRANLPEITGWSRVVVFIFGMVFILLGLAIGVSELLHTINPSNQVAVAATPQLARAGSSFPTDTVTQIPTTSLEPITASPSATELSTEAARGSPSPTLTPTISTTLPIFPEGEWQGTFTQGGVAVTMIMNVKQVSLPNFFGEVHYPKSNAMMNIKGKILSKINDTVEQSKWGFVEGYDPNAEQTLLFFEYNGQIQGPQLVSTVTFRAIGDEKGGVISGVWFYSPTAAQAGQSFTLFRK